MSHRLSQIPGIDFNFSQNIQDNVEEAMSGVKGENSLKLFGNDFDTLSHLANQISGVMQSVKGVTDVGVFRRRRSAQPADPHRPRQGRSIRPCSRGRQATIQAAVGGAALTQMIDGDRRFDFTVRFPERFRNGPDAIRRILLPTPDGNRLPIGQIADVEMRNGAFMIYHEDGRRYIPIKFSVRGRDLASTIQDLQQQLTKRSSCRPATTTPGQVSSIACARNSGGWPSSSR